MRNLATYPPPVQTYGVKAFGPSFTWVYNAEDVAVQSLTNLENMDTPVTMNQLKFVQSLYEPALLQLVAGDMAKPKTNIKEIQDRASTYPKQQWINWHWGAAPDSVIHPSRSMSPWQTRKHEAQLVNTNFPHVCRGQSGREGTVA